MLATSKAFTPSMRHGPDQFEQRIGDPKADQDQGRPYQIIDLPFEVGGGSLEPFRPAEKEVLHEQEKGNQRHEQDKELEHDGAVPGCSRGWADKAHYNSEVGLG